eukprot:TRINITY_DN3113_c0_g2_i2.p1 TRINITY_DN3113_c0_g2~~TRINITY_DN3113_c0_g2_i2.p1  ORF type:complete len:1081 (-),score=478.72 TRINITY_DN3113_c0_g2_i2:42-3284(-)
MNTDEEEWINPSELSFGRSNRMIKMKVVAPPSPVYGHKSFLWKSSLNEDRPQMVVIGGTDGSHSFASTHLFDFYSGKWIEFTIKSTEFTARSKFSCEVSGEGDKIIVYGGVDARGNVLSDLFLLDLEKSEWIKNLNPQDRKRMSGTLNWMSGSLVHIGGMDSAKIHSDFFLLPLHNVGSSVKWRKVETAGLPLHRIGHSTLFLDEENLLMFGGKSIGFLSSMSHNDLFISKDGGKNWKESKNSYYRPSKVNGQSLTLTSSSAKFALLFGGESETSYFGGAAFSNQVHLLKLEDLKWEKLNAKGEVPAPRSYHAAVTTRENLLYVIGGKSSHSEHFNDIHSFDIARSVWRKVSTKGDQFGKRAGHSCSYYERSNELICFGGEITKNAQLTYLSDLYRFNLETNEWKKSERNGEEVWPAGRSSHCGVIVGDNLFILGGKNDGRSSSSLSSSVSTEIIWKLNLREGEERNAMGWIAISANATGMRNFEGASCGIRDNDIFVSEGTDLRFLNLSPISKKREEENKKPIRIETKTIPKVKKDAEINENRSEEPKEEKKVEEEKDEEEEPDREEGSTPSSTSPPESIKDYGIDVHNELSTLLDSSVQNDEDEELGDIGNNYTLETRNSLKEILEILESFNSAREIHSKNFDSLSQLSKSNMQSLNKAKDLKSEYDTFLQVLNADMKDLDESERELEEDEDVEARERLASAKKKLDEANRNLNSVTNKRKAVLEKLNKNQKAKENAEVGLERTEDRFKELPQKIEELKENIEKKKGEIEREEKKVEEAKKELEDLGENLIKYQENSETLKRKLSRLTSLKAIKAQSEDLDRLINQQLSKMNDISKKTEEIISELLADEDKNDEEDKDTTEEILLRRKNRLNEFVGEYEEKMKKEQEQTLLMIQETHRKISETQKKLSSLESQVNHLTRGLNHLTNQLAQSERELATFQQTKKEKLNEIESLGVEIEENRIRLEKFDDEVKDSVEQVKECQEVYSEEDTIQKKKNEQKRSKLEKIEEMRGRIQDQMQVLKSISHKQKGEVSLIREFEEKLKEAKRKLSESRTKMEAVKQSLREWRKRLSDEFLALFSG